jgi:dihydropteroate synthase
MRRLLKQWVTSRRTINVGERTLVMGILNVTPDSFSDGGRFYSIEDAMAQAESILSDGADIIDIGGESTRPNAVAVSGEEELRRVIPIIELLARRTNAIISIDTFKSRVAKAAIEAGAEIINDISGLRFDSEMAQVAASTRAAIVLMHSRGDRDEMHRVQPAQDVFADVIDGLEAGIEAALAGGNEQSSVAIDPGIGFSKTQAQNLELVARLERIRAAFPALPLVVGTSRKRFIGRVLGDVPEDERLHGTMATVTAAVLNGADIVRVHDVRAAVETVKVADQLLSVSG